MQPTVTVCHEPAECFAQHQNCCLSNSAEAITHSSQKTCFESLESLFLSIPKTATSMTINFLRICFRLDR